MAVWLIRAGKFGEHESKFLEESKVFLTWDNFDRNLSEFGHSSEIIDSLREVYSHVKNGTLVNWSRQLFVFGNSINIGDWIIMPSKLSSSIHVGIVNSEYQFIPTGENPYYHSLGVDWIETNIPRSNFDQDILYSFGAFLTVCRIQRNNAEERIKTMRENGWLVRDIDRLIGSRGSEIESGNDTISDEETNDYEIDIEDYANDQLAKWIIRKFQGKRMETLIDAILRAKGYTTYHDPTSKSDEGVDILASPTMMGFGKPRICVQVKSSGTPIERVILDRLLGAMQNHGADHGLLVSWGGFRRTIEIARAQKFFKVRLWGQKEIIKEIFDNYSKLDDEIKAELPLKKIWIVSVDQDK